jgi:hypothetical protein
MKKRAFEKLIKLSIEKGKKEKIIYENGLDLVNFLEDYDSINDILLKSIYGEEVSDIISDFIFDNIYEELEKNKNNYIIYNDNEILADCSTLDGLYQYAEEIRKELILKNYLYDIKEPMTDEERFAILTKIF